MASCPFPRLRSYAHSFAPIFLLTSIPFLLHAHICRRNPSARMPILDIAIALFFRDPLVLLPLLRHPQLLEVLVEEETGLHEIVPAALVVHLLAVPAEILLALVGVPVVWEAGAEPVQDGF
ncbi:hypothetical protein J1614_000020 [Plenodomus biglobosus]|nr:hypothetical protein J1614_000020 [Plenodomus biglobosus]